MDFSVQQGDLAQLRSSCVVVGVHDRTLAPSAAALDAASNHAIQRVLARGDLGGEPGATLLLHDLAGIAAPRVLLVALGPAGALGEKDYRAAVGAAVASLRAIGVTDAAFCLHEATVQGRGSDWAIEQAVLAIADGFYRFDKLKSKPGPQRYALDKVVFHAPADPSMLQAAIDRADAIAQGVTLAKDLGNLPGNLCTPTFLADQARVLGKQHGLRVDILERADVEKLGMGAFLAIARGSAEPPKLIVMEYHGGAGRQKPVVLVGKGITFDSGGISIKPAPEMDEMKFDMCGAASVFGALHAAALMRLPLDVVGIVPATENMPGGNATKPGDVVTTMSGQTVEILDTDSEGRLVLCDALTYAEKYQPAAVIDIATLTGEIVTALGDVATGLFSNTDALAREVMAAGDRAWDRAWQMPLWDDYQDTLKSNFADLPNIGSGTDTAATAACFLSRFTANYPWAHLDIAGTASRTGEDKGATGRPVGLLAHFLAARAAAA